MKKTLVLFLLSLSTALRVYAQDDLLSEADAKMKALSQTAGAEEYFRFSYEHTMKVYRWQYFTTVVLFWTTMALIVTSIVLSVGHFLHGLNRTKDRRGSCETGDQKVNLLSASPNKIEIKTTSIGLVLLIISFMFLLLYMTVAYKIEISPKPG